MVYAKFSNAQSAILKTLIYSDIFNFPLRKDEIWRYLIAESKVSYVAFEKALRMLTDDKISEKNSYFCLKGRDKIITNRQKNLAEVEKKMMIAKKAARYLSYIPTILFIGISGGLAMGDVEKSDDIDFFIITKKNTLFKTRFFILFILELMGIRRSRNARNSADKICVNFLMDETQLRFPNEKHDVYTAHEIAQINPLFDRDNIFSKLVKTNRWTSSFLPNFTLSDTKELILGDRGSVAAKVNLQLSYLIPEAALKMLQIAFMKKHKKSEVVTSHVLIFHPYDYRVRTLTDLSLKYQKLGLLTKK